MPSFMSGTYPVLTMKRWFCEELVLCVLGEIRSGFKAKPFFVKLFNKILFAATTCILALGGSLIGTVHGAIKGQTTETGFLKGALIGAIVGAVAGIQLLDFSTIDGEPFSKAALLRSLLNGKLFMEYVSRAMLKAYQWQCFIEQINGMESTYRENSDIYDITPIKGMSQICIQKLIPSQEYHQYCFNSFTASYDCSICLQELKCGEKVRKVPKCGHVFHLECIDQWLSRQESCPICRVNVYSDRYQYDM